MISCKIRVAFFFLVKGEPFLFARWVLGTYQNRFVFCFASLRVLACGCMHVFAVWGSTICVNHMFVCFLVRVVHSANIATNVTCMCCFVVSHF